MTRLILRLGALLTLVVLLTTVGFAKSPAKSKAKRSHNKTADTSSSTSVSADTKADEPVASAETAPASPAPPAQKSLDKNKDKNGDYKPAPKFTPMLATTGTLGLFTVETADTMPKGGFGFSAFGNKFGRMPGSVTIFQIGLDASYGITGRLTVYGSFVPYQHAHVGCGPELSLAPPNNGGALYPNTIFHTLVANKLCDSVTPTAAFSPTPGFIEDYPFVGHNGGGLGNITLGAKFAVLSERHGNPFSRSIRKDVIIAPRTSLTYLLSNGTVGSPLSDLVSLSVSKQWGNVITTTFNAGYEFTRDARSVGVPLFHIPDQFRS